MPVCGCDIHRYNFIPFSFPIRKTVIWNPETVTDLPQLHEEKQTNDETEMLTSDEDSVCSRKSNPLQQETNGHIKDTCFEILT